MLESDVTLDPNAEMEALWNDVVRVCKRIPPLWNLSNYVAVNPFLGFTTERIDKAARTLGDGLDARVLPELDYYRKRWKEGDFGAPELTEAARRSGRDPKTLVDMLAGRTDLPRRESIPVFTFAERHDRRHKSDWNDLLCRSISRWCAVCFLEGGGIWNAALKGRGLYASWLESAAVDRSLEIAGIRGWRNWIGRLPQRADEAIATMLLRLKVSPERRIEYLYRLLGGVYGWASYLRRAAWEKGDDDPGAVAELLAVRICADAAVAELEATSAESFPQSVEDESIRLVLQDALEDGFVRKLIGKIEPPSISTVRARPSVQAVFCIDVRSEPLRRHLEAQTAEIETLGFAGFFGVALNWQADGLDSARCPVLLKPVFNLRPSAEEGIGLLGRGGLKQLQNAPAAAFSFVELLGLAYGIRLAEDTLAWIPHPPSPERHIAFPLEADAQGRGLDREARVNLAAGILKNIGLQSPYARLILLCGHSGNSTNNPHAASLDCGACGGHGGAINARIASALLNDPEVRARLSELGWNLPADTHFLPAVHDTSTDRVALLDVERVPPSHQSDLAALQNHLEAAGSLVRKERAKDLGMASRSEGALERLFRRRARDWSEVRPEWGLARNAAFIAARRQRTRGVNLEGRAFLHEYDAATDPDLSLLALILSAPMVVASWINLQYFASTVDNRVFGCGNKTLHNRVGATGVAIGNGGDLRTGLAFQSVHTHDGRWYHEPLRLQVLIEASPQSIEWVLNERLAIKQTIENGWVRLFSLDPNGVDVYQWTTQLGWQSVPRRE